MAEGNEPIISEENALMYLRMEARELQRESEHLQAKIDAIKCDAMERVLKELSKKS